MRAEAEPRTASPEKHPVDAALSDPRWRSKLESYARRIAKGDTWQVRCQWAADLVSEVCVRILDRKERYDCDKGSVWTWARGFLKICTQERLRSEDRKRERMLRAAVLREALSDEPSPDSQAEQQEDRILLQDALSKIALEDRELYELYHADKAGRDALAGRVGISRNHLRQRIHRITHEVKYHLHHAAEGRS